MATPHANDTNTIQHSILLNLKFEREGLSSIICGDEKHDLKNINKSPSQQQLLQIEILQTHLVVLDRVLEGAQINRSSNGSRHVGAIKPVGPNPYSRTLDLDCRETGDGKVVRLLSGHGSDRGQYLDGSCTATSSSVNLRELVVRWRCRDSVTLHDLVVVLVDVPFACWRIIFVAVLDQEISQKVV